MKTQKTLHWLCLVLSLMGIFMLFVPILEFAYSFSYYGYKYQSASGFSLLLFSCKGMTSGEAVLLGLLAWGHLIAGVIMLISSINMLSKNNGTPKKCVTVITTIGISGLLYLLEGIVSSVISSSKGSYATTYAEFPFFAILGVGILAVIYLDSYKKQTAGVTTTTQTYSPINETTTFTKPEQANETTNFAQSAQSDGSLFTVDGEVKLLKVFEDYVTLETKVNARAILTHNVFGGNKKIFYQSMLGVQFKESTTLILGYIQFETANSSAKDNFNSENSVTFTHQKVPNEYVKQIVNFVEKKIVATKNPTTVSTISTADELLKFKNLLDSGIISQEEFEKKKKELL